MNGSIRSRGTIVRASYIGPVIGYTNGLGGYLDKATYERLSKDQRRQWYDRGYFDRHLGIESNASPR